MHVKNPKHQFLNLYSDAESNRERKNDFFFSTSRAELRSQTLVLPYTCTEFEHLLFAQQNCPAVM